MRVILAGLTLVFELLLLGFVPAPAAAHGVVDASADLHVAQTLAGNELTVVLRRVTHVPGPLRINIVAHDPVRPGDIRLTATPVEGLDRPAPSVAMISLTPRPGMYTAILTVDRPGAWELRLDAPGDAAVLPFRVLVPQQASWEWAAYGGFALTGLFLAGALLTAVLAAGSRVRWWATGQGMAAVVALSVALTAAVLSPTQSPPVPLGAPVQVGEASGGRPFVNLAVQTEPATPRAGNEFRLRLRLTDGSTGRPVDDLAPHHAALAHTVVTSQDGAFFRHIHPVRQAPGFMTVLLTVDRPGRHLVYIEIERLGSGTQLVTGAFEVAAGPLPALPAQQADRVVADVSLDPPAPVVGRPTIVTAQVRADGRPAGDLQPWLGMAGHLVIQDGAGEVFGHAHEMSSPMTAAIVADETVARHGPTLRFAYTFPTPGTYRLWVQYARDFHIYTNLVVVEVMEETQ